MDSKSTFCVVIVTCGSSEEATHISKTIVSEKLAACVNVSGPIQSHYIWNGVLQDDAEYMLLIKTQPNCLPELEKRVKELHSYEVAEFIALPVIGGSQAYLSWVAQSVG
ncbi:MAG: divalent-cation tolerance protein CutA [Vampirovibrio sp.]|nr:divalent-cation tolerance protein CutA [Vampirovibrio sp.]